MEDVLDTVQSSLRNHPNVTASSKMISAQILLEFVVCVQHVELSELKY